MEAEIFYAAHPRSLVAKRMMSGLLGLVRTGKRTIYVPKYPQWGCSCRQEVRDAGLACPPSWPGSMCGILVESSEDVEPEVLETLMGEFRQCFWMVYRFNARTLRMASEVWSDDDLATLWGAFLDGQRVWRLQKRARAGVSKDWKQFCKVERISLEPKASFLELDKPRFAMPEATFSRIVF